MTFEEITTPAYVIDERKLKDNLRILKEVQDKSGAKILLAQKAYSVYQTYPLIADYLAGATASGIYEAKLAHEEFNFSGYGHNKCGFPKPENHVFEPAFKDDEIEEVCSICDHIVFNSLNQLEHHRPVWEKYASDGRLSVGLRINPEYSADDAHEIYDPCAPGSRLGIRNEKMPAVLPKGVEGLHFHNLCEQGFEPLEDTFLKVEKDFHRFFPKPLIDEDYDSYIFEMIGGSESDSFEETAGDDPDEHVSDESMGGWASADSSPIQTKDNDDIPRIKWINLGGGHHITREDYDVEGLIRLVNYIKARYGIEVYLEPGEAVALNAGYLVTTVMDVVETDRIPVLVLDTSASCHMPDVIEMPYRPPLRDSEQPGEMNYTYRLSSRTCLAGDVMGDYSFEEEKHIGDRLIFEDMAIYSLVKNNTFNGMPLPDIDILHEDGTVEVLKRFDYSDFKSRL
ncbi:MAG: carboxynorspermidine decarboxylase [Butyrivibrio sp.]|nr:carboxynorspermidine decarboxylase [Butyrivibrio sp.]